MEAIPTFCTGDFLEGIYKRLNRPLSDVLLEDNDELWIAELYRFIHGNCALITDLESSEILRRSTTKDALDYNPNFKKLWKNGKISFVSSPDVFKKMESDRTFFKNKTNELYFLNTPKEFCKEVERKYGLVCSCQDIMDINIPKLFHFEIQPLTKRGTIQSWDFLKSVKYPSNSAVIADNYILQKKDLISDNLWAILQSILPSELDEDFDLTIFTREVNDLGSMHTYMHETFLKRLPYKVNLSIGKVDLGSLGLHDRDMITNYCWYHSGAGFTLFKKSGGRVTVLHNTKVFIFPVTHMGHYSRSLDHGNKGETPVQENYFTALTTFKKIWKELPEKIGLYSIFVGERKNRLLD